MTWSVWSVDTVSGVKQQRIPVSACTWDRALNAGGSGSATITLADSSVRKLNIRALTDPISRSLVPCWDDIPVYSGIVWGRTYDYPTQTLTVSHSDIWSLLKRRLAVDHTAPFTALWSATYTSQTFRQFVKTLMILGLTGSPSLNMTLPITLPADEAGSLTRQVFGYNFDNLVDSLNAVINSDGGPDIDFQPLWVSNALTLNMRVGSTATPRLSSGFYEWNLGAPRHGVTALTVVDDATKLAASVDAIGAGQGQDMLGRTNLITNPPRPFTETVLQYKSETDVTVLDALSRSGLATYQNPTQQWGFNVLASGTPKVSDLLLGATGRVWSPSDGLWLPSGKTDTRIVGFSGDMTESVSLRLQPS